MRRSTCLICGSSLVVLTEFRTYTCELCKGQFQTQTACRHDHYVCDSCDSILEDDLIEKVCLNSDSTRPVELAVALLKMLSTPMQGPINQYLVPAVLLTAYYNQSGDSQEKERKLKLARQQAATVIGPFCGLHGICSAGIGTGIFISLIDDSGPLSEGVWGLANQMTTESLRCIDALGNQRCCKRDILMALKTAKGFVQQNFQATLDIPEIMTCDYGFYNPECVRESCPFRPPEN